jgi:hypothetical protein
VDTVWLIVGASMLIVIGSVFWILPDPGDRRRMVLRQIAYQSGFRVKAMKPEEVNNKFALQDAESVLHYYYKQGLFKLDKERYGNHSRIIAVPGEADWQFYSYDNAVKNVLNFKHTVKFDSLDGSVKSLFLSEKEIGILWSEQADASKTEQLLSQLQGMTVLPQ